MVECFGILLNHPTILVRFGGGGVTLFQVFFFAFADDLCKVAWLWGAVPTPARLLLDTRMALGIREKDSALISPYQGEELRA